MAHKNAGEVTGNSKHPTSAEMRMWYEQHKDTIERFESMKNSLQLINPTKTETRTYSTFSLETLRRYMQNPASSYKKLVELSRFLYTRSNPYRKLLHYNASMVKASYRNIIPVIDPLKKVSDDKILKDYWNACKFMNRSNMDAEIYKMNLIAWREDTAFGVFYTDDTGVFILPLSYEYCKVDSIYPDGTLGFSFDCSYFDNRSDVLEYWGEPFTTMYKEYQADKVNGRWQHMDDDKAYVIKVNIDDPTLPLPSYTTIFTSVISLCDKESLQTIRDEASIYKLLSFELETKGDEPDDFTVDVDTAIEYFNKACESLPEYVGAIISPIKVNPISFRDDQAADINMIEDATKALYNSSGGAQILNSASISTTIGWTSALISDEEYGAALIRPQVENNLNRLLQAEKASQCKIKLLPVSPYTKATYKDQLVKDSQYGIPVKLTLNSLNGFSEIETINMAKLEGILNLNELFVVPKSANTTSSSQEGGRPAIENPSDLSDEGDASRSK